MDLKNEQEEILSYQTLLEVLTKKLKKDIIKATYRLKALHGGTVGTVYLVTGIATSANQQNSTYQIVLKKQRKWERYGDVFSWRREFDLYSSNLSQTFPNDFSWPECYHKVLNEDTFEIWMDYIDAPSGKLLTLKMYDKAALALGQFQGKLYRDKPDLLSNINNLSSKDYVKSFYKHYRSWNEVYDYIRSSECDLSKDICQMLIDLDNHDQDVFDKLDRLPIVFCHRDYWNENIFCVNEQIVAIDWDTAGYGYFGEDIASLIVDETDPARMVEYFRTCTKAYLQGFSQYVDINVNVLQTVHDIILLMFGYRLVESYKFASNQSEKMLAKEALQSIYEMREYI